MMGIAYSSVSSDMCQREAKWWALLIQACHLTCALCVCQEILRWDGHGMQEWGEKGKQIMQHSR